MRIAVNAVGLDPEGGGDEEHFLRKSLEALRALNTPLELVLLTDERSEAGFDGFERERVKNRKAVAAASSRLEADGLFTSLDGAPEECPVPVILYLLQLYDLRQQGTKKRLFGGSPLKAARDIAQSAGAIVVPSDFMRREVLELLGVPLDRIVVAPLGVDDRLGEPQPCIVQQPYFLFVGSLSERKNMPMLLEAFDRLSDEIPHNLVVVGEPAKDEPAYWGPRIVRIDRVGTRQLAGLYQHSELVVCPSRYEGSGVVVLEALKAGARVAVGRVGGVPEVAGDAPIFFNAESTDSLVAAMRRATQESGSDRERRRRSSEQVSSGWSWERTARQLMSAFRKAVA